MAACDRIQMLMSENHHMQLPPLPVVPYAATLSLTGALSVLRDGRRERGVAQKDVTARCQTLERLSTSWQNAEVVAKLGRVALRSLQQPSAGMQDFTNLLTGIDADSEHDKEAASRSPTYGQDGGVTSGPGLRTPGTYPGNAINAMDTTDPIANGGMPDPTSVQSEQIPQGIQDPNLEATTYYSPGPYLSQTTRQNIASEFPSTAITHGYDLPALFGNTENMQEFNQSSFFEGFFDLGMPTSLQDVMSDGTLFLNGICDDFGGTEAYARQLHGY